MLPGDFRSWESPQTLPTLPTGSSEYVKRSRNLKFTVAKTTSIQSSFLSSSEGTVVTCRAFKQNLINRITWKV